MNLENYVGLEQTMYGYTLFVEGSKDSIDVEIMRRILNGIGIYVLPLGSSSNLRSLAEKLSDSNRNICFLIDRDHRSIDYVTDLRSKFSNGTTNLIIWKKREFENHFIDAEFLSKSQYAKDKKGIEDFILEEAQKRIFLDAVDFAFFALGQEFLNNRGYLSAKKVLSDKFNTETITTADMAISQMRSADFSAFATSIENLIKVENLISEFKSQLVRISCNHDNLSYKDKSWMENMRGKKILNSVINSKNFSFKGQRSKFLKSEKKEIEVVWEIMSRNENDIPADIMEVAEMIENRANSGIY